jgi:DNA-binding PadR family transcriptional regulator
MYKNLMYICFQNRTEMKIHNYTRSLNTIIMKLLEENGKMYGYEITQK